MANAQFFAPGFDEQVEQQNIERQRKMAELLRQQSAELPQGSMVSGHYVAPSFTQGLAKMLQAYNARAYDQDSNEKQKQLAEALRTRTQDELGTFTKLLQGEAARDIQPLTPNDDEGNPMPVVHKDAVPGDLNAAYQYAAKAYTPALQQLGTQSALSTAQEQAKLAQAEALRKQYNSILATPGMTAQKALAMGVPEANVKAYYEAPNLGRPKVSWIDDGKGGKVARTEYGDTPTGVAPIENMGDPTKDRVLKDPSKPDSYIPNPAMVDYERQTAPLKAPKVSVDISQGQKGFENETTLSKGFKSEPIYKDYNDMRAAYGQVKSSLMQGTPIGDVAGATKIMKLLDPGSVVRESELGIAMAAAGKVDRLKNLFDLWKSGNKLTPQQRNEFSALADELYNIAGQVYNQTRSQYAEQGKRYNLNTDILGPEHRMPEKTSPKNDKRPPLASFNRG